MSISNKAGKITPSMTLAITAKANKLKAEGVSMISFSAGEPDCNTPQFIIDAAIDALNSGKTKYTPSSGTVSLRKKICDKLLKDNNLSYSPNQIVVSNGAKHSLYNAIYTLLNDGDEVIIPAPFWLTYPELVVMCGGVPVIAKTTKESGFKLTASQLKAAITPKTKALILNSPSNPTGSVYTQEELFALAKVVEDSGIFVISDEIYEKLVYGVKHYSIASYSEKVKAKTITINGMSKTYAMTGWRIGYLACEKNIADAIDSVQSHGTSNPNTMSQYASEAALEQGEEFVKEMVKTFDDRRKVIYEGISAINNLSAIYPDGAFYLFVDISELIGKTVNGVLIDGSMKVTEILLEYGVAVIPGLPFGEDNCIRLSYAISMDDIIEGVKRIAKFAADVK